MGQPVKKLAPTEAMQLQRPQAWVPHVAAATAGSREDKDRSGFAEVGQEAGCGPGGPPHYGIQACPGSR
jgi:hypothetical protein